MTKPNLVTAIDDLFDSEVKWISVADNRLCKTGVYAFGYPERTYGYRTYMEITLDDIPALIAACEAHGFVLNGLANGEDEWASGTKSFTYKYPDAKWWRDFQ